MTVPVRKALGRRAQIGHWRAAGWSWERIGDALGISAAHAEIVSATGSARDREYKYQARRRVGAPSRRCTRCGELGHNRLRCW